MEIMYCTTKIFAEPGAFEPMIKQAEALIEGGGFKGNGCANAIVKHLWRCDRGRTQIL